MKSISLSILFLIISVSTMTAQETITFPSKDGLEVTADLYKAHEASAPFIILFHQARWSRGEYLEIAPKLNKIGFNCLAVDQRSGEATNGVTNETYQRAKKAEKGTQYVDAIQDMEAAIDFVKQNHATGKVIIWGSSYSSALSLRLAGDLGTKIDGVLAFAPGEYFSRQGKPKDFVTQGAKKIQVPSFITSAKKEKKNWWGIHEAIPEGKKAYYLPETEGNHGSRALWEKFDDNEGYWVAVKDFLKQFLS